MSFAARSGDIHTCPAHIGGPIAAGCPTVKIGGRDAARKDDTASCQGPTDTIVTGAASVLIGNKQAARVGVATAHGGLCFDGESLFLSNGSTNLQRRDPRTFRLLEEIRVTESGFSA